MKEIGGYFELELPLGKNKFLHSDGILLNSGRHALEYILLSLHYINKLWIPYYTCEVLLQPIKRLNIKYEFYHINEKLEIDHFPYLGENDYIIINNFFGIKDSYVEKKALENKNNIIIDQAQAWYANSSPDVKSFYSPRKFFGIPDGGIAYLRNDKLLECNIVKDYSFNRCSHLLKRYELMASEGYEDFRQNSQNFNKKPIKWMSSLTKRLLESIDMRSVKLRRLYNFKTLSKALNDSNLLEIPNDDKYECPMIYPYYSDDDRLRKILIDNKVFVATYWPNVLEWCSVSSIEYKLAKNILPLPIDQRYDEEDMNIIISIIKNHEYK